METQIQELKKQVKNLKLMIGAFALIISTLFLFAFKSNFSKSARFDDLTVGTLNIAGPDSVKRMILTYKVGDAPWNGKKVKRNVPPNMAGILFLNPDGNEVGGRGWTGNENSSFAISSIDYSGIPLEAIGFNRIQDKNTQSAEFIVMDNPRRDIEMDMDQLIEEINTESPGKEVEKLTSQMVDRVKLGVKDHSASLLLSDQNGKPRIKLVVDQNNEAKIIILDESGNQILSLPE